MTVNLRIVAEDTAEPLEGVRVDANLWGEDGGDGGFTWAVTNGEGIAVFEKGNGVEAREGRPTRFQIYLNPPQLSRFKSTDYQTPETWLTVLPDGSYHPTEFKLKVANCG